VKDKYCCFLHPKKDYAERELSDICADCGKAYGFPIHFRPDSIRGYRIIESLDRGFYGAAYVAEKGDFGAKCVIKISPVDFYAFFSKTDFFEEAKLHRRAAEGTVHIVRINDAFRERVQFSDDARTEVDCYVTELEYVDGVQLSKYLTGAVPCTVSTIAQITIDLLHIRAELERKQLNHNDLHAKNLMVEFLPGDTRRMDAIDPSIRVRAIDLGSIADGSKSDRVGTNKRFGDLTWMATHIDALIDRLFSQDSPLSERDYRPALALQATVNGLIGSPENQRLPDAAELVTQIRESFYRSLQPWRPWRDPLTLRTFGEHYNAQTLNPWDAPHLLVDPDGEWLKQVSRPGPQIITGMRGCGKTLLLRSMEFHARASIQGNNKSGDDVLKCLKEDGFVGLFVSSLRLLDLKDGFAFSIEHRLTQLLVHYALQAVRALWHLEDISKQSVVSDAHLHIAKGISAYVDGVDSLEQAGSLRELERQVERIVIAVNKDPKALTVRAAAAQVFPHFADALRKCSPLWQNASVFFLLDDVSTRHLSQDKIATLLSSLLFSDPKCAFKLSSEWQTIELGLRSPGQIHPIRIDRDVSVFDLGSEVHKMIVSKRGQGVNFVEKILGHRAKYHAGHPPGVTPRMVLGNQRLIDSARAIAGSPVTSTNRKNAYWGLNCVARVCVGDIGDVIKLYDKILAKHSGAASFPISPQDQSDCFLALSSERLWDLNRRQGRFKDYAKTFGDASHEELVKSHNESIGKSRNKVRLRQYSSIYIRVTAEDELSRTSQIEQLRELIDAGVFVYTGGGPRTKTKDSNPLLQFKLSYRKIYGLSSWIGLSDRDRFELSGKDLELWLKQPEKGLEILLRNLGGPDTDLDDDEDRTVERGDVVASEADDTSGRLDKNQDDAKQLALTLDGGIPSTTPPPPLSPKPAAIKCTELTVADLARTNIGAVILGYGFESRTFKVAEILAQSLNVRKVIAVRYQLEGRRENISELWRQKNVPVSEIHYDASRRIPIEKDDYPAIIDVSGLSKPLIFDCVRRALSDFGRVYIAYGLAKQYYPLAKDIEPILAAESAGEPYNLLSSLGRVLTGEKGPYTDIALLPGVADQTRKRALLAFASPKHERIFGLLDSREYDEIEIVTPTVNSSRTKVSQIAAETVERTRPNAHWSEVSGDDLQAIVDHCDRTFIRMYLNEGANVELGLTGSKLQAVAVAALSAVRPFSQAWYLSPSEFDVKRFTTGFNGLRIFEIAKI